MAKHSKAHPGFKAVQKEMAGHMKPMHKGETPMEAAGAALAAARRKASPAAKKRNPRLKKVRGAK